MNELQIKTPSADDLVSLGARLAPLPLFVAYGANAETLSRRWIEGQKKGEGLLVASGPEGLLGLCWFLKGGTFSTGAYLRTLAVVPQSHSRGVGAALLQAYEQACDEPAGGWFLLASDFNGGAHRFYARHGYAPVGRLPDFAKKGIVEHIYWKAPPP